MVAPARPAGSGGEWTENIDVWWKNIQRELKRPRDDIKPPQWLSDIKAVLNKEEENGCGCAAQRKQKVDEEGPSMVQRQLTPPASASTRPPPRTPVQRLQRIDCKLPANVTPGAVITVHTPAGDPVRLKVPQGATPGAYVEFSVPAFPPRLYARATGEAGTFGLTVPEGLVGGSPIRAMTPDGLEVNMALPNEATPGRPITFKIKVGGAHSMRLSRGSAPRPLPAR